MKLKSDEVEQKYYAIKEVAGMLGVARSKIRFLEVHFGLRVRRNRTGRRYYSQTEIDVLRDIVDLSGLLTLDGVRVARQRGFVNDIKRMLL